VINANVHRNGTCSTTTWSSGTTAGVHGMGGLLGLLLGPCWNGPFAV
jgi:hypothetical protein